MEMMLKTVKAIKVPLESTKSYSWKKNKHLKTYSSPTDIVK